MRVCLQTGSAAVAVTENGATASGSATFTYTTSPTEITSISANTANVGGTSSQVISFERRRYVIASH